MPQRQIMTITKLLRRFLLPGCVISLYYFFRFGAKISLRAEVELSQNLKFGPDCTVSSFVKFKASDGPLTIGTRSGFATGCFVAAGEQGIAIGDNFVCGPNVTIVASNFIYEKLGIHFEDQGSTSKGIRIGKNVWVGANSTILDGSVIGDDTIVVANSLINRRYPPHSILQGNPARVIKKRIIKE